MRLNHVFAIAIVLCFIYGWIILWSCNCDQQQRPAAATAPAKNDHLRRSEELKSKSTTFLLAAVLSAPGDSAIRAVIRDTWMRLSAKGRDTVTVIFPMGVGGLSSLDRARLDDEHTAHGDLALIDNLYEHYSNLTRKTLATMVYAHENYDFRFLLKVDSDSFVRLGVLLKSLKDVAHPRLYWGFLDGRARPIRKGKWKESDWILCDRYLPYQTHSQHSDVVYLHRVRLNSLAVLAPAPLLMNSLIFKAPIYVGDLGGGYVLAADLVSYLATNARLFKMYKNEDVAVGAWLAGLDVKYVHDPRFDTEFRSRGCSNQYLITHKKSAAEMLSLYNNVVTSQLLCEKEFRVRASYVYDWSGLPSECCTRSNASNIP